MVRTNAATLIGLFLIVFVGAFSIHDAIVGEASTRAVIGLVVMMSVPFVLGYIGGYVQADSGERESEDDV